MPRSIDSQAVGLSVKIYAHLLVIYPKGHREEYGPAMKQVFRDQCRADWNQGGAWGLAAFWLRVLVDLVTTSTAEHFRNLKQRISMLSKLRRAFGHNQPLTSTFRALFVVVFVLSLAVSICLAFFGTKIYGSMTRIAVGPADDRVAMRNYDPYLIQREFEMMTSDAILGRVARKLNLTEPRADASAQGPRLSETDAIRLLRSRLELRPTRNTSLIEIRSRSSDPKEAADIANALAMAYKEFNNEQLRSAEGTAKAKAASVTIVDHAEPDLIPVQPNKAFRLFLGIFGGILLASFVGGAGVLFVYFNRRFSHPR